jgi:GTPase involved in cell partitioning and DNA repair
MHFIDRVDVLIQAGDGGNGLAGFNRVGYSGWVPALSKFQNFIYR